MKERINRQFDEDLYQPKIHSDRIKSLYQIKLITGLPLTVLVDMAIVMLLEEQQKQISEQPKEYGKGNVD